MEKEFKLHAIDYSPYFAPAASVETFMQAAGHLPSDLKADERNFNLEMMRLYFNLIQEEFRELELSMESYEYYYNKERLDTILTKDNLCNILDGAHDLVWVTLGMLLAMGFPIHAGWYEVANSNLAKIDTRTQKLLKREDGKILKPEGWKPPDFLSLIEAHLSRQHSV